MKKRICTPVFSDAVIFGILSLLLLFLLAACGQKENVCKDAIIKIPDATQEISEPITEETSQVITEFSTAATTITTISTQTPVMVTTEETIQTQPPSNESVNESVYDRNLRNYNSQGTDPVTLDYYKMPSYQIQSDSKEIVDLALSITGGITNDYDKAKAIYIWVANNIAQDIDFKNGDEKVTAQRLLENPVDALNTLKTKVGMCINYTNLTVALLRASGFPAKVIRLAEDGHQFCEAYIDGKWVIMDSYFDCNNKYQYGKIVQTAACGNRFFDMSVQDIWDLKAWYLKQHLDFSYYVDINYFYCDTSLKTLTIPDGFYSIGDVALAGCSNLLSLYIPESVASIGVNVFSACSADLTIYGKVGSYAEKYAKENNIKFIADVSTSTAEETTSEKNTANAGNINNGGNGFIFIYNGVKIRPDGYLEDILPELGEPVDFFEYESCASSSMTKMYSYDEFDIAAYAKNGDDKDRVYSIEFYGNNISTAEGVSIGQTYDDMVSGYGAEYQQSQGFAQRYMYSKGGTSLTFSVENGVIISIVYNLEGVFK